MKKHRLWKIGTILLAVLLVIGICCAVYVSDYYRADAVALAALEGTPAVQVEQTTDFIAFVPEEPVAGLVIYPGGKVEHSAYAPLALALAEQDILCVVVQMPFRLAVLDVNAADGIPEQFPQVENWYIGGHSLGGSMAADYAAKHGDDFRGVVLLAAYSTADLTDTELAVLSLYGEKDGVLNMEKYEKYHDNLPKNAVETVIEGGNHCQFGSYGHQSGDGEATISAGEQIEITADLLAAWMAQYQPDAACK